MNNSICQGCGVCIFCGRKDYSFTYGLSGGAGSLDGEQTKQSFTHIKKETIEKFIKEECEKWLDFDKETHAIRCLQDLYILCFCSGSYTKDCREKFEKILEDANEKNKEK